MKLILTLVYVIHCSNAIVDLPGVDVLSSGYDAASWTTKYKIFDFSEEAGPVHIVSINKTFNAPAMVNVVTDGMNSKRVEDSCVDVATHFEEYVYMYRVSRQVLDSLIECDNPIGLWWVWVAYPKTTIPY